jgi:hypothetical protein
MTIEEICEKYKIKNYHINEDGTIDVDGDVLLSHNNLLKIPLRFGRVGGFNIAYNRLTSLEGCPTKVDGHFSCARNYLTSLEHCPKEVGGGFYCNNNELTDLKGCPEIIGEFFHGSNNDKLTSIKDGPKEVGGHFECASKNIYNLDGFDTKTIDGFYSSGSPLHSIFNHGSPEFIDAFKIYKVVKDKTVNLKRLKYVMSLFDKSIDLERIGRNYTIV